MNQPLCYVLVAQSCLTLWDPMDCSLPGSSVPRILQARILEWVAISFSRGSSVYICPLHLEPPPTPHPIPLLGGCHRAPHQCSFKKHQSLNVSVTTVPVSYGLNYIPPRFVSWNPNLRYFRMWLYKFGDGALKVGDDIQVWLLGCALTQYNWCPHKERKSGHAERHHECLGAEERPFKDTERRWPSTNPEERSSEKPNLLRDLDLILEVLPPEQWENTVLLFMPP